MNEPTAKKILSLLVDLLADQHGVKVKYNIVKKEEGEGEDGQDNTGRNVCNA